MPMSVNLPLPAVLTMAQARSVLEGLAGLASSAEPGPWCVDASALSEFDTSALSVLLDLQRRALARGVTMEVRQAPPKLRQLAALYGVDGLLGLSA